MGHDLILALSSKEVHVDLTFITDTHLKVLEEDQRRIRRRISDHSNPIRHNSGLNNRQDPQIMDAWQPCIALTVFQGESTFVQFPVLFVKKSATKSLPCFRLGAVALTQWLLSLIHI